jgi:hypothetical protein
VRGEIEIPDRWKGNWKRYNEICKWLRRVLGIRVSSE